MALGKSLMSPEGRRRALLLGYYGADNLGDDLMLLCLVPWLRARGMDVDVVSEAPEKTTTRFHVRAVRNTAMLGQWDWKRSWLRGGALRLFREIAAHDALVVGGGDLIRDDKGWRTFSYTMEKIVAALLLRKPLYLVNVGISEPVTRYGRMMLRWMCRRSRQIIVRDQRSAALCRQLGRRTDVMLVPDIVFGLPDYGNRSAASPHPRPYAVVSLRAFPNAFRQYPFTLEHVEALARSLDQLAQSRDLDIVFLPFHHLSGASDDMLHREIARRMKHTARVVRRDWSADVDEVLAWMGGAEVVIGMRLHAVVLAAALGRPCVALPYDVKIREFAGMVGLHALVDSDQLLAGTPLLEAVAQVLEQPPAYHNSCARDWQALQLA